MDNEPRVKIDLDKVSKEHELPLSLSIVLKCILLSGKSQKDDFRKDNLQKAKFFIERELMKYK